MEERAKPEGKTSTIKGQLLYFGIRGRGEPIRLLCEATGVGYSDEVMTDWKALKATMAFGQVPYFVDHSNGLKLVQSMAILRYIGRETGTYGDNSVEAALIDMIIDGEEEWKLEYIKMIYSKPPNTNFEHDSVEYINNVLPAKLAIFERLLKENNGGDGFFVGKKFSILEPVMFEMLDVQVALSPNCLDSFPLLKSYRERIGNHGRIAEYIKSGRRKPNINGNGKGNPKKIKEIQTIFALSNELNE